MGSITELITGQDRRASFVGRYTHEKSDLFDLSSDFPPLQRRNFSDWLRDISYHGDAEVFEFGGGVDQIAARQILRTFPGVSRYTGYEVRAIGNEAAAELANLPQFTSIQGGLAEFNPSSTGSFDIAFAHLVAEHLPHPFLLVRKLHQVVRPGGVVFVDGIHLYKERAVELEALWRERGYNFKFRYGLTDSDMVKSGISRVGVALQKTTNSLLIPILTSERLRNFSGKLNPNHVYQIPDRRLLRIGA